jgi:nitroimidazol reductase NimA-like FMN-containing flavoprotein (pyridoxamine 5'-phosphate oxidase superfamily)
MSTLESRAAAVIAANKYLTLATVDGEGRPWATPVYFTPDGHEHFYWVSSPQARHSRNLAVNPVVSIVVFDSTVAIGDGQAVYLTGEAHIVPDEELADRARFYAGRLPELREFSVDELRAPADLRLYRATVTAAWTLVSYRAPENTTGLDERHPIWFGERSHSV